MLNTYMSFQNITRDMTRSIDNVAKQPLVGRETEYYLENISKVKTIEDFVKDDRLFKYAMKAHGLDDMSYAKAFMVKALKEGVEDPDSFANKLSDQRYRKFVDTFNFAAYGETATIFTKAQQGTVDKYLRQTLEEDAGRQNEGVRLALYFERNASRISNGYDILADPALARVVRTALALPEAFASSDVDRQAKLFESRLELEDFKDPEKVGAFLQRFTSLWELENPSTPAMPAMSVLFGQPVEFGISTDVLLTIQKFRS